MKENYVELMVAGMFILAISICAIKACETTERNRTEQIKIQSEEACHLAKIGYEKHKGNTIVLLKIKQDSINEET
jgi:hypothetical protein